MSGMSWDPNVCSGLCPDHAGHIEELLAQQNMSAVKSRVGFFGPKGYAALIPKGIARVSEEACPCSRLEHLTVGKCNLSRRRPQKGGSTFWRFLYKSQLCGFYVQLGGLRIRVRGYNLRLHGLSTCRAHSPHRLTPPGRRWPLGPWGWSPGWCHPPGASRPPEPPPRTGG